LQNIFKKRLYKNQVRGNKNFIILVSFSFGPGAELPSAICGL